MRFLPPRFSRHRRHKDRPSPNQHRRAGRRRALIESLEDRKLLATITVDTPLDVIDNTDGVTSLREAVVAANGLPGADVIEFDPSLNGVPIALSLSGTLEDAAATGDLDIGSGDLSIVGNGTYQTVIDGGGNDRVFDVLDGAVLSIEGLTIQGGRANDDATDTSSALGGGILVRSNASVTLTGVNVSDNAAAGNAERDALGGGIYNDGDLTLVSTNVHNNRATGGDGGTGAQGADAGGGGIAARGGQVTISSSTISNNSAVEGAAGIGSTDGNSTSGGIDSNVDLTITNSTISGNHATNSAGGIGISGGAVSVVNSTITNNSAVNGGGLERTGGSLTIHNSIIAANVPLGTTPDLSVTGTPTILNSLIGEREGTLLQESQTADPTTGNIVGAALGSGRIDPRLAALGFAGGATRTHALLLDSPALDAGNNSLALNESGVALANDQRERPFVRSFGTVDMGAYELQTVDPSLFEVTTPNDEFNYFNSAVSLREAIAAANGSVGPNTISFVGSVFVDGTADTISLEGGLLEINDSVTISGPGADLLTISGNDQTRVLVAHGAGTQITLSGVTLTGGSADIGGAVLNSADLTLADSTITGNQSTDGGAIYNSGTLTVTGSTISGNTATGGLGGGAIYSVGSATINASTISGNSTDGEGGGIYSAGSLSVLSSTISGNEAAAEGGGIRSSGDFSIVNSTISGNTSVLHGGGLHASDGQGRIVNTTITLNAASNGGGIYAYAAGSLTLHNSIAAANQSSGLSPDLIVVGGSSILNSLIGEVQGSQLLESPTPNPVTGNLVGAAAGNGRIDPMLEPLGANGGPTATHALMPGSPGIDLGEVLLALGPGPDGVLGNLDDEPLVHDQRGIPTARTVGDSTDVGASERQVLPASSFVVTTAADELDFDNSETSLREAIISANISAGDETITFDPGVTNTYLYLGDLEIGGSAVTIQGNGARHTVIDASYSIPASGIFTLTGSGAVTFEGLTLTGGSASGSGGAINSISDSSAPITIRRSNISGNTSNGGEGGGAISTGSRELLVVDSTISGNSAAGGGGGIHSPQNGDVTLINSTLSGNASGTNGGGLHFDNGDVLLVNSTVTDNTAGGIGGGINVIDDNGGESLTIRNSIVAANQDSGIAPDLVSPVLNQEVSYSLIGDNLGTTLFESQTPNPITFNIVGSSVGIGIIDPLLGPLASNGGPTETHALLAGSPAIDAGSDILAADPGPDGVPGTSDDVVLVGDQRDAPFNRIDGAAVDIGAFESQVYDASFLIVNTVDDVVDFDPAQVSLREAIISASEIPGDDTITFDSSVFSTEQTISLSLGELSTSDVDSLTIDGPGSDLLTVDAQGQSRVLLFNGSGDLSIQGITLTGGQTSQNGEPGDGAGIRFLGGGVLSVTDSSIVGNTIAGDNAYGGGIFSDGDLTITGSTISGNSTGFRGGGIYTRGATNIAASTISDNTAGAEGGGIFAETETTITGSTISGNSASGRGGGLYMDIGDLNVLSSTISGNQAVDDGGGIISPNDGDVALINSTVSGNTSSNRGGGLFFYMGDIRVINSTVTGNVAVTEGGGIGNYANGYGESLTIHNSIIAGNTSPAAPDFLAPQSSIDLDVRSSLIGNNVGTTLSENQTANALTGNFVGDPNGLGIIDPMIGPLADNGGPTQTHTPLVGSLAIDNGDALLADGLGFDGISGTPDDLPLIFDQRGTPNGRTNGITVDMGSVELDTTPPTIAAPADVTIEGDTTGGASQAAADAFLTGATAADDVNPNPTITHDAPTVFPIGQTTVTFTADDGSGNTTSDTAIVTVVDTTAPILTKPADISVEGDNIGGANAINSQIVAFLAAATATDIVDANVAISNDAPSLFLVGNTVVTFTAIDDAGNSTTDTAVVEVTDTTAPSLTVPANISVQANVPSGAEATLPAIINFLNDASAADIVDADPVITDDAPAVFPIGDTTVTFTATDNNNNQTTGTAVVTVTPAPNTEPTISDIADLTVAINTSTPALSFTVGDAETPLDQLSVIAISSDQTLIPHGNITFAGTGADRTITLVPATDQTGTATITVRVTDGGGLSATDTFDLTVSSVVSDPVVHISPSGPGGSSDPADLPSGPQPTSWAQQRSDLRQIVIDLGAPIASVAPGDLTLTNLGVDAPVDPDVEVPLTAGHLSLSQDGLQLTISFGGYELNDGVYQLELSPAITSGDAFTITGDATNKFYVLNGDWNGSGGVNIQDFSTFAYWFGTSAPDVAPEYVDINNTGGINIQDFSGFAANFGKQVIFPSGASSLNAGSGEGELVAAFNTLANPIDVNGDGLVNPRDALNLMNEINRGGGGETKGWSKFDANGDGRVNVRDALFVINRLNDEEIQLPRLDSILDSLIAGRDAETSEQPRQGPLGRLLGSAASSAVADWLGRQDRQSIRELIDSAIAERGADLPSALDEAIDLLSLETLGSE